MSEVPSLELAGLDNQFDAAVENSVTTAEVSSAPSTEMSTSVSTPPALEITPTVSQTPSLEIAPSIPNLELAPVISPENIMSNAAQEIKEIDKLTPDEKKAVLDFVDKIDLDNTQLVLQYGSVAQAKISKFSDSILQETKTKDTSVIGDDLIKLTNEIRGLDVSEEPKGAKKFFGFLKPVSDKIEKSKTNYSSISTNIDNIVVSLEGHQRVLLKDVHMLDTMYENNKSYFKELTMYILAGEEKLERYQNDILAQKALAESSSDQIETQKLNDMVNTADRFEKKIHDLKLSKTLSLQMAPQIRLLQNNNSILVEKIQSSIVNAIPLWKNQIVIALGLENSKKALEAQTKVTDLTNELLLKNSEMLKQGSIDIAKETERSIVSIETVQKTNENLIDTINEVLQIQKEGHKKRQEASIELVRIEGELKQALLKATTTHLDDATNQIQ